MREQQWAKTELIITPKDNWIGGGNQKSATADAKNIAAQIKRHVDDVAEIEIKEVFDYKCSFCGWGWDDLKKDFNGCCAEDIKHEGAK